MQNFREKIHWKQYEIIFYWFCFFHLLSAFVFVKKLFNRNTNNYTISKLFDHNILD